MRALASAPAIVARRATTRDAERPRRPLRDRNRLLTDLSLAPTSLSRPRSRRGAPVTRTIADDRMVTREDERGLGGAVTSELARALLALVANSDGGNALSVNDRRRADEDIERLETEQVSMRTCEDERIFGYYDVSYVSVGANQVGNPAGGRFRSPLGRFLFRTIGLEQNLFAPNRIENRVAFTVLGCLPGEVTLEGTFAPVDGLDDGRTVKATFDSPGISVGGGPKLRIGPKSSVVLSTTYLDETMRLGKGSRGSLFVFTRKTAEQHARDLRRWSVGGLAIATMLLTGLGLGIYAVHQLKTSQELFYSITIFAASLISILMAYVLRDGGIVAEDADLVEVGELTPEQKAFLNKGRADGQNKGENVFGSQS
jgi:hypothetical protein